MSKKQKEQTKNKIIIISLCLMALLLILAIITVTVLNFQKYDELSNAKVNIIYYNESEKQEENNVLIVNLDNKNETNENNIINEPNTNKSGDNKVTKEIDIPYYIKVNYQENVVTVYKKDLTGNYTVPIKAMLCSCGEYTPPCPKYPDTVYKIPDAKNTKYIWGKMEGNVWAQYATRIIKGILFHSVPYTKKDKSSLEWWEYDKLGTSASLGCVRLAVKDAKWIYDNCIGGTVVEFYASSNPGPLGKPTAQKISEDEEVRGWDPTDPDKNNPWADYLKRKEEETAAIEAAKAQEEAKTHQV